MTSGKKEETDDVGDEVAKGGSKDSYALLHSSLNEIKDSLERLTKSVGELNSKLRSTGDVLKWILDALSKRSDERETLYLRNVEASTELLRSFMAFLEERVNIPQEATVDRKDAKLAKGEISAKEATIKEEGGFVVKPSLVKRLQEDAGKDKKSR